MTRFVVFALLLLFNIQCAFHPKDKVSLNPKEKLIAAIKNIVDDPLLDNANIGIYNVALKIATFSTFSLQAINSILAPKIARSYASDDKVLFQRVIRFGARINFFSTLVIVLGIILGQKWILQFFGDDFVNGTPVLIILCIGQVISSMSGSVGVILQMTGKQGVYQNIMLVALILNLVLNFSLTPVYGNFGAAVATVVSIAAWNLIGAIYLKRNMNIVSYYDFK